MSGAVSASIALVGSMALALGASANAYELRTHERITGAAFARSRALAGYLADVGIDSQARFAPATRTPGGQLADFENTGTVRDWMIEGAIREDDSQQHPFLEPLGCPPPLNPVSPIDRPLHHFFDVQRGGRGLTAPGASAIPAMDWALGLQGRGPTPDHNQFSVLDARIYQLTSLTAPGRADREENTALLFRTLGQVVHVLQDMAQPQHVRNDPHAGCLQLLGAGDRSWYEDYLETRALGRPFRGRREASPPLTLGGYAPVPFGAYRDFWTHQGHAGLAEFSSRNFFSAGTNLSPFAALGRCGGLPEPPCDPAAYRRQDASFEFPTIRGTSLAGRVTLFLRDVHDPLSGDVVPGVAVSSRSLWDEHLERLGSLPTFSLNTLNYDAAADVLLPRAVGYSAGFLDYFFRGRLEVEMVQDEPAGDAAVVRVRGTNASPDPMENGRLRLYAEALSADPATDGVRVGAAPLDGDPAVSAAPGDPLPPRRFRLPEDTERVVAVYTGTLGSEAPAAGSPGAVLAKTLGGVRVEQLFSDGVRWNVRTPRGVFPLPLRAADVVALRWGDGESTLVGHTALGPGQPNRFIAYRIRRAAGSPEIPLRTEPDGSRVVDLVATRQVPWPFGLDLGTTVAFTQTFRYRQYLRSVVFTALSRATEVSDARVELMVDETRPVSRQYRLRLEAETMAGQSGPAAYRWTLHDIGLTAGGRILALVAVTLISPNETVEFPTRLLGGVRPGDFGGLAPAPVAGPPVTVALEFPPGLGPVAWIVVDVAAPAVVASTAPAVVVIRHDTAFSPSLPIILLRKEVVDSGVRYANPPIAPLILPSCPLDDVAVLAELQVQEGTVGLELTRFRDEIAGLAPAPVIEAGESVSFSPVRCLGGRNTVGFKTVTLPHLVRVARLDDALRPPASADGERMVLLVAQDRGFQEATGEFGDSTRLVSWKPAEARAEVKHEFSRPGIHVLWSASPDLALVLSAMFADAGDTVASTLVPLEGATPVEEFGDMLLFDFVVLAPGFLYDTEDLRFYRRRPPLQRMGLPARLAPVAGRPRGDYHAIRLP